MGLAISPWIVCGNWNVRDCGLDRHQELNSALEENTQLRAEVERLRGLLAHSSPTSPVYEDSSPGTAKRASFPVRHHFTLILAGSTPLC
jgi:regulator of replication initiation timing